MNLDDVMQAVNAQQNEQIRAATKQLASVVSEYYTHLIAGGVSESDAPFLAGQLQDWILESSKHQSGGA